MRGSRRSAMRRDEQKAIRGLLVELGFKEEGGVDGHGKTTGSWGAPDCLLGLQWKAESIDEPAPNGQLISNDALASKLLMYRQHIAEADEQKKMHKFLLSAEELEDCGASHLAVGAYIEAGKQRFIVEKLSMPSKKKQLWPFITRDLKTQEVTHCIINENLLSICGCMHA